MPMRKRSLARELDIADEDYRDFRLLLDDMVKSNEIAELKRGKFGLPLGAAASAAPAARGARPSKVTPRDRGNARSTWDSGRNADAEEVDEEEDHTEQEDDGLPKTRATRKGAAAAPTTDQARYDAIKEKEQRIPKGARVGRIDVKRGGMGFLLSEPPGNDVFIAESDLGGAMSGDLVAVEMKRSKHFSRKSRFGYKVNASASRPVGRVIKIIERAHARIVGTFYAHHRREDLPRSPQSVIGHIIPDTPGMFAELDVLAINRGEAKDKDKVAAELVESKDSHRSSSTPTARIVKVFGPAGDPTADIGAIIENFNIKTKFPDEVLQAAEEIPDTIPEEELAQRVDYTQPVTFTIDPQDAKDHDDAVAISKEPDGRTTLLVHIADVSYYVPEDSVIDLEARDRATSVYLPGTVYPMLPQKLSNNMCSLKEGQLRLTKTARMTFDKNLNMQQVVIERSFIRSAAFLTYDQVREGIDENKPELVRTPEIFETLKVMKEFAMALREKRMSTGSLNLEMPEAKLLLDEKLEVKGWTQVEHHWAHELIEDMMLAANRAVAEYMVEHEIPGMYRIHEDPDEEALKRFQEFVREFGIQLRPPIDRLKLKSVLDRVKGKEYEHTVSLALLTSLKQARYSAECHPHFALNFNRYLHFTSPIRRYPDLVVHRALDTRFEPGMKALPVHGKKRGGGDKGREYHERIAMLQPLAAHCSLREREADNAEEEVVKFRQMQFLRRNMRESHPGLITRVRDFGLFVELQDCFVEGLVRVQDLSDDYYEYFENQHLLQGRRHRRSFRLGDKVEVRILKMDLGKKQVDLEIV
ncbi:MAG TPA: ribonuclease R [Planctomycetota bacterium]|nr:ribonuclease R [Planctomycetota bacterium]